MQADRLAREVPILLQNYFWTPRAQHTTCVEVKPQEVPAVPAINYRITDEAALTRYYHRLAAGFGLGEYHLADHVVERHPPRRPVRSALWPGAMQPSFSSRRAPAPPAVAIRLVCIRRVNMSWYLRGFFSVLVSSISPVAILPTMTAAPITSAGRFSPRGPRGIRYSVSAFAMRVSLSSIEATWSRIASV
jgi:hypothetical protein